MKNPNNIQSGLKFANHMGFLEGYNQALSDMMIAILNPNPGKTIMDELKVRFATHYETIMGGKVPGGKE